MAEKFELWFGCLGNGTTVCNKAVEENGDYKKIAHISEGGETSGYMLPSPISLPKQWKKSERWRTETKRNFRNALKCIQTLNSTEK